MSIAVYVWLVVVGLGAVIGYLWHVMRLPEDLDSLTKDLTGPPSATPCGEDEETRKRG